MVAQITLEAWNQEKYPAYDSVETIISRYGSRENETIVDGPKDIDLNGLKAKTVTIDSITDDDEWNVHFTSKRDYYIFEKDGYLYILHYGVIDEKWVIEMMPKPINV